jgi:hypothetical protein
VEWKHEFSFYFIFENFMKLFKENQCLSQHRDTINNMGSSRQPVIARLISSGDVTSIVDMSPLLDPIHEVLVSNLGSETGYPEVSRGFPRSLQEISG